MVGSISAVLISFTKRDAYYLTERGSWVLRCSKMSEIN